MSSSPQQQHQHQQHSASASEQQHWSLSDFEVGQQIGDGRFGSVYLAREKSTNFKVAIKCIRKSDVIRYDMQHQLEREVRIQKWAGRHHPHVLQLHAYFWDDKFVYLITEYSDGGDLSNYTCVTALSSSSSSSSSSSPIRVSSSSSSPTAAESDNKKIVVEELQVASWIRELLESISFLHSNAILHRDLKPDNIFLKHRKVKLADFTWSVSLGLEPPFDRRRTICGTLDYLSPELVSHVPYSTELDVWSIGVVAYELLVGRAPFEHPRPVDTCLSIQRGEFTIPANTISSSAEDFLKSVLVVETESRPSAKSLLQHPWIVSSVGFSPSLLLLSSSSRSRSRSSHSSQRNQQNSQHQSQSQHQHQQQKSSRQQQQQQQNRKSNTASATAASTATHNNNNTAVVGNEEENVSRALELSDVNMNENTTSNSSASRTTTLPNTSS